MNNSWTELFNFQNARVENIVGKGENVGNQHFLRFQHCFLKGSFLGLLKVALFRFFTSRQLKDMYTTGIHMKKGIQIINN